MHPEQNNTPSRTSANGSPIPCFIGTHMGLPPHTPPSGRPLDRVDSPPNPRQGLLPSRPPGERGEQLHRKLNSNRMSSNARMNSC